MKIEIKSIFGELIFEYECENNTIKKTVEKAVKEKVSLRLANLRLANLSSANLSSSDLSSANLSSADLSSADLSSANLSSADLSSANLSLADLYSANLPIYCKWNHSIVNNKIKIGCKSQTIEEWDLFFESDEIYETKRNTDEFKQIEAVYLAYKSYLIHLNK
jgi:hypothetical protein